MAIIRRETNWVHDYVTVCYEGSIQATCYMIIHPMETHDSGVVDERTGAVIKGKELDNAYSRRIFPPTNPRPPGRPQKWCIESQTQRVAVRRCSKCHETGHYKNTCHNLRANFDDGDPGVVVCADDMFMGNLYGSGPAAND